MQSEEQVKQAQEVHMNGKKEDVEEEEEYGQVKVTGEENKKEEKDGQELVRGKEEEKVEQEVVCVKEETKGDEEVEQGGKETGKESDHIEADGENRGEPVLSDITTQIHTQHNVTPEEEASAGDVTPGEEVVAKSECPSEESERTVHIGPPKNPPPPPQPADENGTETAAQISR